MASTPSGTQLAVAATFQAAKTVSGVSNAAEAVVSSTAHGFSNGDIVQIYSGWGLLNRSFVKVKSVTTDTFVAEAIDTSNTDLFPVGGGAGTARKVLTWQSISRYKDQQNSGGEPKTVTVKWTDLDNEESLNDGFTAMTESFNVDADNVADAMVRLRTGAAATKEELQLYKQLLPQAFDSEDVKAQKIKAVRDYFAGVGGGISPGSAGTDTQQALLNYQ